MLIFGIETSCDETAAAVVRDGTHVLSNVIASSVDLHQVTGGVVPEVAAREHLRQISPVVDKALKEAKTDWSKIDAIAVFWKVIFMNPLVKNNRLIFGKNRSNKGIPKIIIFEM